MLLPNGDGVVDALSAYLQEVLGGEVRLTPCVGTPLPAYLSHTFDFSCGEVLGVPCVFAVLRPDVPRAPGALEKQLERIAQAFDRPAVLVPAALSARDRQRLVARRVPFVVPFVHAFLPRAIVDSREGARPRATPVGPAPERVAPTTQLVLLHALLSRDPGDLYAQDLAEALGVSPMSVSRAFRELEAAGITTRPLAGRPRPARLALSQRQVWQQAQPLLRSPVRARYLTAEREFPCALDAGLTALARITDLAPPRERIVAIAPEDWHDLRTKVATEPFRDGTQDPTQTLLEVWSYAPAVLAAGPTVDVLSLYLSLREQHDERVELALEQAMETLPW